MFSKVVAVVVVVMVVGAVVGVVEGDTIPYVSHISPIIHPVSHVHQPTIPYDFGYGVTDYHTGTDFGHTQNSDGNVVTGVYHVLLPDGRRQVVRYTADHHNGYRAQVTYEGPAHHHHR